MNLQIIVTFIPLVILFAPFLVILLLLYGYGLSRRGRKTPLTRNLLRSPGESLRALIDGMTEKIIDYLLLSLLFSFLTYTMYITQKYFGGMKERPFILGTYVIMSVIVEVFCLVKMWRLLKQRSSLLLGLDGELEIGQSLNQLMLEGCRVYHDFPAEKFNIDHVVVGPRGVFAVETKGRSKPDKKGGPNEAKVFYDGQILKFPSWTESEPIEQAKRQAVWFSKWLSSAVGEYISVQSVLALPGWYIVREKPADLIIFNGKNPEYLYKYSETSLSETLIKRIVHQLEQRCRDVEPKAYPK